MVTPSFRRQSYADDVIADAREDIANAKHGDYYVLTKHEMKRIKTAFEIMRKRYYGDTFMMWQCDETTAVKK